MKPDLFSNEYDDALMSEINMTPFIDVILVLLIIFLVTIPVIRHTLTLTLPEVSSAPQKIQLTPVKLSIGANGSVSWDGKPIDKTTLPTRFLALSKQTPQPELHIYADRAVRYEYIAQVMAAAQANQLTKLTFVTEPALR